MENKPAEILHPFLSPEKINAMTEDLGRRISKDYASVVTEDNPLLSVVTLKGALFFAADLVRQLTVPVQIDFVRCASYGSGTKSSGNVKIMKDLDMDAQGRHVLILDEIVDSGHTLTFLINRLKSALPASLKVGALLSKPSRREIQVPVDYLGQEVEDKFLIGYGLDYGERYRNLPGIFTLGST